jgi:lipoprotein-anchoring transpeptidase ErfK/SrfK
LRLGDIVLPLIIVRKSIFSLELVGEGGTETFRIAIGLNPDGGDKASEGDCRTPEGEFRIVSIEESSDWEYEGIRSYGPYFLRLECPPWEGIGIHGTDEPDTIGAKASRGCIRMRNEDLERLVPRIEIGTKVRILP